MLVFSEPPYSAPEHCVTHPFYIQLFKELFGIDEKTNRENQCRDDIPVDILSDIVQLSSRNNRQLTKHPANFGPTLDLIKTNQLEKGKSCMKEVLSDGSDCSGSDGSDCDSEDEK